MNDDTSEAQLLAPAFREADDVHRDDALAVVLHVCGAGGIDDHIARAAYGLQSAKLGALQGPERKFEAVEVEGATREAVEDLIELSREAGAELPAKELERAGIPGEASPPLRWLVYVWHTLKDQRRPEYVERVAGDDGGVEVERFILQRPLIASAKVAEQLAGEGGDTPSSGAKRKKTPKDWLGPALMLLKDHPEWTVSRIAEEVGVHRGTLSKNAEFKRMRQAMQDQGYQPRRGHYDRDREDIEAIDD